MEINDPIVDNIIFHDHNLDVGVLVNRSVPIEANFTLCHWISRYNFG